MSKRAIFSTAASAVRRVTRHPLTYLLAYISVIPLFAIIYCHLPWKSFYAPYAKYEPSAYSDSDALRIAISTAVRRQLGKPKTHLDRLYWSIDPSNLRVGAIEPTDLVTLRTKVTVLVEIFGAKGECLMTQQVTIPFEIGLDQFSEPSLSADAVDREPKILAQPNVEYVDNDQIVADLFPPREQSGHRLDLEFTNAENKRFRNFMIAMSGEPFALSDSWLRMLYFSAVTITTTGFGDIVPLTTLARLLAGTEAVLGWILAGLFLNALAQGLTRRSPQH